VKPFCGPARLPRFRERAPAPPPRKDRPSGTTSRATVDHLSSRAERRLAQRHGVQSRDLAFAFQSRRLVQSHLGLSSRAERRLAQRDGVQSRDLAFAFQTGWRCSLILRGEMKPIKLQHGKRALLSVNLEARSFGPSQSEPAQTNRAGSGSCPYLQGDEMAASNPEVLQTSIELLHDKAARLRIDSVRATSAAGSGHPTSCASMAEITAVLFFSVMRYDPKDPKNPANDIFVLSKGHAAPILYAAWAEAGLFPVERLLTLRRLDSDLEGHPTPRLPFVDVATGSLGQGLSAGLGIALNY